MAQNPPQLGLEYLNPDFTWRDVCFSPKTGGLLHAVTWTSWDWMDGWTSMTSSVIFLHHQLHLADLSLLSSARDSLIMMVRCSGPDRFILNSNFPNEGGFWVSPFNIPTLQQCVCEILRHSRCSWAAHRTRHANWASELCVITWTSRKRWNAAQVCGYIDVKCH